MKSRAAVAWEVNKPLSIETTELSGPRAGEVLVEVMATGVCHDAEAGRSRHSSLHARVPPVQNCLSQRSNLCTSIRATQGRGLMPDKTAVFLR